MHILNVYAHMCTCKYNIFRKQTHDIFFHAYDLVLSTGPLKLPGCLSSAWPLKRRLRLRLRRWGFFSLSSVIAKFTIHELFWQKQQKNKSKITSFLQRFKEGGKESCLVKTGKKVKHTYWQEKYTYSFKHSK